MSPWLKLFVGYVDSKFPQPCLKKQPFLHTHFQSIDLSPRYVTANILSVAICHFSLFIGRVENVNRRCIAPSICLGDILEIYGRGDEKRKLNEVASRGEICKRASSKFYPLWPLYQASTYMEENLRLGRSFN